MDVDYGSSGKIENLHIVSRQSLKIFRKHWDVGKVSLYDSDWARRIFPNAITLAHDEWKQVFQPARKEFEIIDLDRQNVPLGLSTSILTENDSELRGVIAIFSDLTEAKLAGTDLKDANLANAKGIDTAQCGAP